MISSFASSLRRKLVTALSGALVALFVVVCLWPAVVSAHAMLLRSEPAENTVLQQSPDKVAIFFSETLEPRFSNIAVLDAHGNQMDKRDSKVNPQDQLSMSVSLPVLPDGIYTVSWLDVSAADGHALNGAFLFSVRVPLNASSQPAVAQQPLSQTIGGSILKWLALLSLLGIVGSLAFEMLVWRPVLLAETASATQQRSARILSAQSAKLRWSMLGLFGIASVGQLIVQAMADLNLPLGQTIAHLHFAADNPIIPIITGTVWGNWWLWRMLLVVNMAVAMWLVTSTPKREPKEHVSVQSHNNRLLIPLFLGCGALFTLSLVSHGAAAAEVRAGAVFSDFIHLLAAAVWIGGLILFAVTLSVLKKQLPAEAGRATFAVMVPRFSILGVLSVGTLVISGLYGAWVEVGSVPRLTTIYGMLLSAKTGLFVLLLGFAALNGLWVRKLLTKDRRGVTWLNRFVLFEVALGIMALLATGFLSNIQTGRETALPNMTMLHSTAQGIEVEAQVTPGRVGLNTVTLTITNAATHKTISDVSQATLQVKYLSQDLGDKTVHPQPDGSGHFVSHNVDFGVVGPWEMDLTATRGSGFDVNSTLTVAITDVAVINIADKPSGKTGTRLWGTELALLGIFYPGVLLSFRRSRDNVTSAIIVAGMLLLIGGFALLVWT